MFGLGQKFDLSLLTNKVWLVFQIFLKFVFSKKAIEIDEIFIVDLTVFIKCQIHGEDFVKFSFLESTNFKIANTQYFL